MRKEVNETCKDAINTDKENENKIINNINNVTAIDK